MSESGGGGHRGVFYRPRPSRPLAPTVRRGRSETGRPSCIPVWLRKPCHPRGRPGRVRAAEDRRQPTRPGHFVLCAQAMAAKDVIYELKLVGGPYDGTRGLTWRQGIGFPLPEFVLVGVCPGDGLCTASERECRQLGHGKPHTAYWVEDEEDVPENATAYELFRSWIEHDAQYGIGEYTIPGLQLPRAQTLADKVMANA